ncbi:MAG: type II toxin-antitoxin system HicA family toxin [Betaproteobacteria bacterium]|nr:type II toxin-antitoxin system HicA family toxin [Betaproteobacteria bacterium]
MNGKQVISLLKAQGWVLQRISGSHHVMGKDGIRVPVPVHGTKDIKPGTLANIARVTGIKLK